MSKMNKMIETALTLIIIMLFWAVCVHIVSFVEAIICNHTEPDIFDNGEIANM